MPKVLNFYLDDSGTRHPDHKPVRQGRDWFALGGILLWEGDEDELRRKHTEFCGRWRIASPLHSSEIRCGSKRFRWLAELSEAERETFFTSLSDFLLSLPAVGLACVIDRPGYNHRYLLKYGRRRWFLCKTAFAIAVERATKFAIRHGGKLRVLPERCSKRDDAKLKEYYLALLNGGHPFDKAVSGKYGPVTAADYRNTLHEFRLKHKTSAPMQVADPYLWPMCMGGYHSGNRSYRLLADAGKLIDCQCSKEETESLGIKYSCFDLVKTKP
ncbi:MAG: DUF3800 domain-containing protein [Pyrinomonadaceae bacterium]